MRNILWKSGSLRMGGLEKILIEILKNIDKEKFKITLIIDDDCGKRNIFEKEIPENIEYYFLKSEKLIELSEKIKSKKEKIFYKILYNIMMSIEKIVVVHNMKKIVKKVGLVDILVDFDAGAAKYVKKLTNIKKKIVWIHNSIPNLKKKNSKIKRFGKRLKKYDEVVVICDDMKREIQKIYPFLCNKVRRIYNSFNFNELILKSEEIETLTDREKELIKEKYFLSVARLDEVQKDFKTLIKSFSDLKNKEYKLYIIGDGPDKENIENLIKELNLEKQIYLLGRKENPYVWMKNAEAFIHSSKYEGFCLVILEALILGKAVIASNCKVGPSEILLNGKYGELFEVGNREELKTKIEKLIENKELKNKYELLSKEAIQRFDIKNIILEIERFLNE